MAYAWYMNLSNDATLPEAKKKDRRDDAMNVLKAGVEANPSRYVRHILTIPSCDTSLFSFVLNFAYAEAQEAAKNLEEVHAIYEKFLEILRTDLETAETRVNASNPNGSQQPSNGTSGETSTLPPGFVTAGVQSQNSSFNTQGDDEKPQQSKELHDKRTQYGVAWIMCMRFARRAENLRSARAVFGKARRDRWTPWEVYEAAGTKSLSYFTLSSE